MTDAPATDAIDAMLVPEALKLLRGPLSKRATSAEFNEWQARDIVQYVDALLARLRKAEQSADKWMEQALRDLGARERAEQERDEARRERDELDFLLNEGGSWEKQLQAAEARAIKAEQERDEACAHHEHFVAENEINKGRAEAAESRLAEMEKQEPVAWLRPVRGVLASIAVVGAQKPDPSDYWVPLYASPVPDRVKELEEALKETRPFNPVSEEAEAQAMADRRAALEDKP